jgi:hypothetical protein
MSELLVFMVEAGIIVLTASGSRRACKEEYSYLEKNWAKCIWKFENNGMKLTLQKIKVYKNGKLSRIINTGFTLENNINGN